MAYCNTDKALQIYDDRRRQFPLNQDVLNPRIVDIVNTSVELFLRNYHGNTDYSYNLHFFPQKSKKKTSLPAPSHFYQYILSSSA